MLNYFIITNNWNLILKIIGLNYNNIIYLHHLNNVIQKNIF